MASLNMRERLEVTLETLPAGPVHQMQPWGFASIDSFLPSAVETKKAAPPAGMRAERAGSVLAQHCIAEGEIQQAKTNNAGWYVRLARIVVDEKGQLVLPWMSPIARPADPIATLPAAEVPAASGTEELRVGDCVRVLVTSVSDDLSSINVSMDTSKLSRFQTDNEASFRIGRIPGMQGLGAPLGKYNAAIMQNMACLTRGVDELARQFGIVGPESLLFAEETRDMLSKPTVDLVQLRRMQDLNAVNMCLTRGQQALSSHDVASAKEAFQAALETDSNCKEAIDGLAAVAQQEAAAANATAAAAAAAAASASASAASAAFATAAHSAAPQQRQQQMYVPASGTMVTEPHGAPYEPATAGAEEDHLKSRFADASAKEHQQQQADEKSSLACQVCRSTDHVVSTCPSLMCGRCKMWGHEERFCAANRVDSPPEGTALPASIRDWERLLTRSPKETWTTWRPAETVDSAERHSGRKRSREVSPSTNVANVSGHFSNTPMLSNDNNNPDSAHSNHSGSGSHRGPSHEDRRFRDRNDRAPPHGGGHHAPRCPKCKEAHGLHECPHVFCHGCGEKGHIKPQCPKRANLRRSLSPRGRAEGFARDRYERPGGPSPHDRSIAPPPYRQQQQLQHQHQQPTHGRSDIAGRYSRDRSPRGRSRSPRGRSPPRTFSRSRERSPDHRGYRERSPDHRAPYRERSPRRRSPAAASPNTGGAKPTLCAEFMKHSSCSQGDRCPNVHIAMADVLVTLTGAK